jgi:hypothetical protein
MVPALPLVYYWLAYIWSQEMKSCDLGSVIPHGLQDQHHRVVSFLDSHLSAMIYTFTAGQEM